MKKELSIEIEKCNKCMSCVEVYPNVFKLNKLGFIEIREFSNYQVHRINEAIKYCPHNCIKII